MKIDAEYVFNCPLEKTLDICVNQTIGNLQYFKESFENVADVKLIKLEEKDGKKHVIYEFCAHGQIPKAVQHLLKPDMLTWREISYWDSQKKEYHFSVKPHYFTNVFTCKGYWGYMERGPEKSAQVCHGDLIIRIPIFGNLVEKAIWTNLKRNWDDSDKKMKKKHGLL
jgi:hypothetical protein